MLSEFCEGVEVIGSANSAEEGVKLIDSAKPDLVFLDIEMPHHNGFYVLENVKHKEFHVIFVTAYNHYAIKAIKFSALDYLLKPVDMDDLQQAIDKAKDMIQNETITDYSGAIENMKADIPFKLAIPTLDGYAYIKIEDIIRVAADGSYSNIFMENNQRFTVSRPLREYAELLNETPFFRPHKSHLINLKKVKSFSRTDGGYITMDDDSEIRVSRDKKLPFTQAMANLH
jgi:two-component system LytT family response regulator